MKCPNLSYKDLLSGKSVGIQHKRLKELIFIKFGFIRSNKLFILILKTAELRRKQLMLRKLKYEDNEF